MSLRLAILISGRGSNMLALCDRLAMHGNLCDIRLVAADNNCAGLALAKERGLESALCNYHRRPKAESEAELISLIEQSEADYILLAGFMRVLSADFVSHFDGRILNIHPSLLPKYKGLNTHQRALDANDKLHGVSVHLVTAGLDEGPLIAQAAIPIAEDDDAKSLAARLLPLEHTLYAAVIEALITKTLTQDEGEFNWHEAPQISPNIGKLLIPRSR